MKTYIFLFYIAYSRGFLKHFQSAIHLSFAQASLEILNFKDDVSSSINIKQCIRPVYTTLPIVIAPLRLTITVPRWKESYVLLRFILRERCGCLIVEKIDIKSSTTTEWKWKMKIVDFHQSFVYIHTSIHLNIKFSDTFNQNFYKFNKVCIPVDCSVKLFNK